MSRIERNPPRRLSDISVRYDSSAGEFVLINAESHSLMGHMNSPMRKEALAGYLQEFGQDCFKCGYQQALRDIQAVHLNGNPDSLK